MLSSEASKKYELVDWTGPAKQFFGRHGEIDVSTLTLEKADKLYAKGWTRLRLKPAASTKPASTGDTKSK